MERGEVQRFACGLEGIIPYYSDFNVSMLYYFDLFKMARSHPGFLLMTVAISCYQLPRFRKAVIIMDEVDGMGLSLKSRSSMIQ